SVRVPGAFGDIRERNRPRQLVIGLGAGEATIDAKMRLTVWSGNADTILARFETHVDSGEMPGAAITMGAGAAAQGGVTAGMAVGNAGISGVKADPSTDDPMIDSLAAQMVAPLYPS